MNPDSQNPTQEPDQNTGMNDMPQAPAAGTGDNQAPAPAMPPAGDAPEAPAGDAGDESDHNDGAKW